VSFCASVEAWGGCGGEARVLLVSIRKADKEGDMRMHRSRRASRRTPPREGDATLSPDVTKGVLAPKLPHERDETPDPAPGRDRTKIARAAADLAAGRTDTDCYGIARKVFQRAGRGRSR
jgi:hypothetical protein